MPIAPAGSRSFHALSLGLAVAAPMAGGCKHREPVDPAPLNVAAAADLTSAFGELSKLYERETGQRVVVSFGATGLLEKQIAEGAPFDVFAAANTAFADDAIASGACLADSKTLYATGRVVLFCPHDAPFRPHVVTDLTDPRIRKIAIANPAHAPYGRAAKQAMTRAGVWAALEPKIVYGENVQEALQFAKSGNADVAFVARSLATTSDGEWTAVPPELHDRIDQALVVCVRGRAGPAAGRRFTAFVVSAEARAVMQRFGFEAPDLSPPEGGSSGQNR